QRSCRIPEGCGISDRLGQRSGVSPPSPQRGLPQPPNLLPLLCNGTMTSPTRSSGPRGWKLQPDSARSPMLTGVGGFVLGLIFLAPGLLTYLKGGDWLRRERRLQGVWPAAFVPRVLTDGQRRPSREDPGAPALLGAGTHRHCWRGLEETEKDAKAMAGHERPVQSAENRAHRLGRRLHPGSQ
ncbi:unnamed protein product, partial [Natator depressus]